MPLTKLPLHRTFTLQQDQQDCGVACLLSIIKYYGGSNTIENLRKLSGTNITGTTLLGLYQAAMQAGFAAEGCEADMASLIAHESPCILHVQIEGNLQHYLVCYGATSIKDELHFIVGDPAKGITHFNRQQLETIWQSKACLTLLPNVEFKKVAEINHAKRKWIITLLREDMPLLGIAVALGVAIAALGLAMAIFSQRLIDDILPKKNFFKLNLGIALVFVLLLIKEGLSVLRQYFLLRQSKDFNIRIIDFFYHHLLQLPKPFFDTRKIGELTARLNDTSRIQRVVTQLLGNVVIDALMVIVSSIFIFMYAWQIGLVCMAALPIFFMLIYWHHKQIIEGQRAIMSSYALAEGNYISTLQGIEAIKNHNKQSQFSDFNKRIYQSFQDKVFSLGQIQLKLSFWANVFGTFFLMGILFFASYQVLNGHLKTGELIAILGMCGSLLPGVANLAMISIPINEAKVAFDRMFEFTSIVPEIVKKESSNFNDKDFVSEVQILHSLDFITDSIGNFNRLQIQNLSFRFAGRSQILKHVSLEVSIGEIIAIMGENGCGKSILTQILQKHYQLESGTIVINDHVLLEKVDTVDWRNKVGVVPQNVHIFNTTVLENIAFDDAISKPQQVLQFLQQHGFNLFIDTLPQSYMTLVGEEGINLSGGQKQMLALARALYHKPQLLILDEATAAMDRQSEQFVLELLLQLKKEMGIIFITHRLHILKSFCDRIYILENGTIDTQGNHHKLLQSVNLYSRYWADLVS